MGKDTRINVTLDFNADLKNIQGAVGNIQKSLQGLSLPQGLNKNFLSLFSNLEAEVKNFGSLTSKELTTAGDFSAVEKSGKKILDLYRKLGVEIDSLSDTDKMKLFPPNTIADINKITNAMKQFNSATDKNKGAIAKAKENVAEYTAKLETQQKKMATLSNKTVLKNEDYKAAKEGLEEQRKAVEQLAQAYAEAETESKQRMESSGRTTEDKRTKQYKEKIKIQAQLTEAQNNLNKAEQDFGNSISQSQYNSQMTKAQENTRKLELQLEQAAEELKKLGDGGEAEAFKKMMDSLKDIDGIDPSSIKSFEDLEQALQDIKNKAGADVDEKIEEIIAAMRAAQGPADQFGDNMREAGDSIKEMSREAQDLESLKHRILDFFSISNAVQLFKRAVNSAFDTVKELDATMTEAAVVTDFSVGDMWDKLPSYSGEASKLGATINDLYGATTLYYQQGLKTNEAMALGTETMKMARIAGMESAEATEAMTAALRGFNMALNETSATKVNDVYSELAAITAADTEQIATAMSKTASIAANANMEFETTSALLAQIIETTQEAPETAGTALKTIIARFSEVKKLASEGANTGEDSEGGVIDVNKIQTALKTVGISMDEFFAGTKGLDEVFLELASKWNTLDFETQRYIATTAAGSRQQSRFIAMMSNYDRTMELVSAANNSAGASQEQFNKTLESLDSKLNNLKNAWDEFVMGLANNELIKAGVDILTSLLTTINKIISSMSGGSGIVKTFVTSFAAIGAFKLGQKGLNKFLGNAAPKEGILAAILGKGKAGEAKTLGIGWGKEAVDGFKDSFTKGAKDIFSGKKMTNFLFGNMGPIDASSLKDSLTTDLAKLSTDQTVIEPVKIKLNEGDLQGAAQQMRQIGIDAGYTDQELAKLGVNMDVINGAADGTIQKGQEMGKTLGQIGTYGAMAGAALMSMIPMLEEMGASDEVIAVIKGIAVALMALPVVMKVVELATHAFAKGTTAAISSIPIIGWIAAAISALIALGSILASVIDTPEEKLKKAKQALEEATAAAEKAKETYDNLLDTKNKYTELISGMTDLKEGTLEWRQALIDTNNEVLNLLDTYPELINHIERLDNGQLIITETGWEQITISASDAIVYAQGEVASNQAAVTYGEIQSSNSRKILESNITYLKWDEDGQSQIRTADTAFIDKVIKALQKNPNLFDKTDVLTREDFDNLYEGFQRDILQQHGVDNADQLFENKTQINYYAEDFRELFTQNGYGGFLGRTPEEIYSQADAFIAYTNELNQGMEKIKLQISNNLAASLAEYGENFNYLNQIIEHSLKNYKLDEQVQKEEQIASDISENYAGDSAQTQEIVDFYEQKGIDFSINETAKYQTDNLNEIYKKIDPAGYAALTDEQKKDKDFLSSGIASRYSADKRQQVAETQVERVSKLNESQQKNFMAALTGDYSDFSAKELSEAHFTPQEYAEKMYADEGLLGQEALDRMAQDFQYEDTAFKDLSYDQQYAIYEKDKSAKDKSFEEYSTSTDVSNKVFSASEIMGIDIMTNQKIGMQERGDWLLNNVGLTDEQKAQQAQLEADQAGLDSSQRSDFVNYLQQESDKTEEEKLNAQQAAGAGMIRANLDPGQIEAIATANMKLNAGFSEIVESYDDWSELIDKTSGKIEANTADEIAAFNSLKKSVNKMLNTSHELSDAFWDNAENVANIKKAAEGDVEALEKVQKAAAQDYLIDLGIDKSTIDGFADVINDIDLPALEAGVELTGYGDFITKCNDLIAASGMTADQVSNYFKNMGYDVEFDANPQETTSTQWVPETSYTTSGSLLMGTWKLEPETTMVPITYTDTISAPTIKTLTSTGSGGGGVSASNTSAAASNKPKKSGGGGGSKKPEKQHWENPYEKTHNLQEQIDETLRERNQLERDYDRILVNRTSSTAELLDTQERALENLKLQTKQQRKLAREQLKQIKNAGKSDYLATRKNSKGEEEQVWTTYQEEANRLGMGNLNDWASYNEQTGTITIDWARIEALENDEEHGEDMGSLIEAYISELQERSEAYEATQDRLQEIYDEVRELNEQGVDTFLDTQQQVYDALVQEGQEQIDSLTALSEIMAEDDSKMIDALQESVDLERQIRDNTKQRDEISEMETRLAFLRSTGGGRNALEIKELEEQLKDARTSYNDSLVDQKLSEMSEQNAKAEEQRQEQINTLQSILEWQTKSGHFWDTVKTLWEDAFDDNGDLKEDSELVKLLKRTSGFEGLSDENKWKWLSDLINQTKEAILGEKNLQKQQDSVNKMNEAKQKGKISNVYDMDGKAVSGGLTYKNGQWVDDKGYVYSGVTYDVDSKKFIYGSKAEGEDAKKSREMMEASRNGEAFNAYSEDGGTKKSIKYNPTTGKYESDGYTYDIEYDIGSGNYIFKNPQMINTSPNARQLISGLPNSTRLKTQEVKNLQNGLNDLLKDKKLSGYSELDDDGSYGPLTKGAVKALQTKLGFTGRDVDGKWGPKTYAAFKKSGLKAYKTGGIADFTGLAWLDGTKSKPEIILNQQDSKNFIMLKDVLAEILQGATSTKSGQKSGGDNYFDISIIVDEISSDYDVDQMAARIKQQIYDDSTYRNVNAINLIR